MSFVATARPPVATAEPPVSNDPWFPEMEPAAVRDACRLDGTITTARLLPALNIAEAEMAEAVERLSRAAAALAPAQAAHG